MSMVTFFWPTDSRWLGLRTFHTAVVFDHTLARECDLEALAGPFPPNVARAVLKRKVDYAVGRHCARQALTLAGSKSIHVGIREVRAPLWPDCFVGSITHSDGYGAAVVASTADYRGIGIDCEAYVQQSTAAGIRRMVLTPRDEDSLRMNTVSEEVGLTLIFSAKESIFKAIHPLTLVFFEFHDVVLTMIDFARRSFTFELQRNLAHGFDRGYTNVGQFDFCEKRVYTGVFLHSSK